MAPKRGVKLGKRNPKKGGRPTLFKLSMIKQSRNLILMGYTHEKIAEFYGVGMTSIYKWKRMNQEFANALNTNKDENDSKVVRSLFDLATGYNYTEKKKEVDNVGVVKTTRTKKHVAPNVGAIKTWLYNRRPAEFKPEAALSTQGGGEQPPAPPLNITYSVNAPVKDVKITVGSA